MERKSMKIEIQKERRFINDRLIKSCVYVNYIVWVKLTHERGRFEGNIFKGKGGKRRKVSKKNRRKGDDETDTDSNDTR